MSWAYRRDFALRQFLSNQYDRSGSQYSSSNFYFDPEPDSLPSTNDSSSAEEDFDSSVLFGMLRGNVVGLRYYTGVVNNNEMVALQREPRNPYDRNAVKVNNVNGEQVGHIKRELAAALAQIMDRKLAKLEGIVPYGAHNAFTMPVNLRFWGREENKQVVMDHMKKYGFKLEPLTQTSSTPDELQEKLVNKKKLVLSSGSDEECSICLDSLNMPVITRCAHIFCKECICQVIYRTQPNAKCPMCRGELRLEHLLECPDKKSALSDRQKKYQKWMSSGAIVSSRAIWPWSEQTRSTGHL